MIDQNYDLDKLKKNHGILFYFYFYIQNCVY